MLTDFQDSLTFGLSSDSVTKWSLKDPPYLRRVAIYTTLRNFSVQKSNWHVKLQIVRRQLII